MISLRWPWGRARRNATPLDPWYGIEYLRHTSEIDGVKRAFEYLRARGFTVSGDTVESVLADVVERHRASTFETYESAESRDRRARTFISIIHGAYVLLGLRPVTVCGLLEIVKRDVMTYAPNLVSEAIEHTRGVTLARQMETINRAAGLDEIKPPAPEPTKH